MGFSTERQQPTAATSYMLQELALAAPAQTTRAVDATSIRKAHEQAGAYQGIDGSCKSRAPGTWANLSTSRLWAAAAGCCNLGLRILLKVQDAFLVLLLPGVYLPSAKQAGSFQQPNFQLTQT